MGAHKGGPYTIILMDYYARLAPSSPNQYTIERGESGVFSLLEANGKNEKEKKPLQKTAPD